MLPALLLAVDFQNFTYHADPCNAPVPVVMRRGSFEWEKKSEAQVYDLHVRTITEGTLRAGTRQAVVVLTCDYPTARGGTAAAYAFDERGSGAVLLAKVAETDWGSDWGQGPESFHVRFADGRLSVEHCDSSTTCKKHVTTTYVLRGNALATVAVTSRPDPTWLANEAKYTRVNALVERAQRYSDKGDYGHAIAAYTQALRLDPNGNAGWYADRAEAYRARGQYSRAIADYTSALRRQNNTYFLGSRGEVYALMGDRRRALSDYTETLRSDRIQGRWYADRGFVLAELGDDRRAIDDFSQAIRLWSKPDPLTWSDNGQWALALQGRAFSYYKMQRYSDTIADATAALAKNAHLSGALYARGLAKRHSGDIAGGDADVAAATRLDPNVAKNAAKAQIR